MTVTVVPDKVADVSNIMHSNFGSQIKESEMSAFQNGLNPTGYKGKRGDATKRAACEVLCISRLPPTLEGCKAPDTRGLGLGGLSMNLLPWLGFVTSQPPMSPCSFFSGSLTRDWSDTIGQHPGRNSEQRWAEEKLSYHRKLCMPIALPQTTGFFSSWLWTTEHFMYQHAYKTVLVWGYPCSSSRFFYIA